MNDTTSIEVDLGPRSYRIVVGVGTLDAASSFADLSLGDACVIVTNLTIAPLYADRLKSVLARVCPRVHVVTLPDGEAHKNWHTLQTIFDAMLGAGCDRGTTLFALGGGVVGDMTGFAAACYMRGVACVQVPTTLLAQVDSAVGGKTAINHPAGKNMIGAFHQPVRVVVDIDTLATLPRRERVAGLAEVIKYGVVADDDFLTWIESNLVGLLALDGTALTHAIRRSCEIKAEVVASDEREGGVRAVLNFGHTFAHAIETGTGYGTWLHGEAVGCGMAMAADLSVRLGLIDEGRSARLITLIAAAGLPTVAPDLGVGRYLDLMRVDKKAVAGEMRFVVWTGPGRAGVRSAPDDVVRDTLTRFVG